MAVKYGTDPRIDLAAPRLHFSNPPLCGNASTGTVPLLARPLSPSADLVSDAAAFDKVRDFGDLDGPLGNRHTAIYIDRYEGNLNCNGDPCAFSGRARSYLQQGVGLMWAEWALTLNKGGAWARVSFTTANPTYTP